MIKAICFDLFHTLIDVAQVPEQVGRFTADILGLDREAWNDACFSPHHPITQASNHADVIRLLAHSLDPNISEARIQEAVDHRQRRFDYALTRIDSEVLGTLMQLKDMGLPLALISNASTAEVAAWSLSPLCQYFDVALFSCEVGLQKPDPNIFHMAGKQLGISTDACLFVGDGGSDEHRGARQAGMLPLMVTEFISPAKQQQRRPFCRWELHSIRQLPDLVTNLGA